MPESPCIQLHRRFATTLRNCSHKKRFIPRTLKHDRLTVPAACHLSTPIQAVYLQERPRIHLHTTCPSYLHVPPSTAILWERRRRCIVRIRCSIGCSSLSSSCYDRISYFPYGEEHLGVWWWTSTVLKWRSSSDDGRLRTVSDDLMGGCDASYKTSSSSSKLLAANSVSDPAKSITTVLHCSGSQWPYPSSNCKTPSWREIKSENLMLEMWQMHERERRIFLRRRVLRTMNA
jgi:hypothetical protein